MLQKIAVEKYFSQKFDAPEGANVFLAIWPNLAMELAQNNPQGHSCLDDPECKGRKISFLYKNFEKNIHFWRGRNGRYK